VQSVVSNQNQGSWNRFAALSASALGLVSVAAVTLCDEQKDPAVLRKNGQHQPGSYIQATSPEILLEGTTSDLTAEEERLEKAALKAKKHGGGLKLFSGNGNLALSLEIARILGINLGKATVGKFADGEVNVQIHENVRGKDVYIVQPTCPPVNDNLMELLLMVSTMNRASARRITVVIPYYGYARQDRKMQVSLVVSKLHNGSHEQCCN
jgi:ribose-phosphate pyrophosphokinase